MKLKGKNVLITGAAKRIGREIALEFAEHGANVVVHYQTSRTEAEQLVKKIRSKKVKAEAYQADLSDPTEIRRLTESIQKGFGSIDILVNNASVFFRTPLETATEADWNRFVSIHLKAPFFLAQALAPTMKKRGGRIINIADWSGLRPYRDYLPYCASKAGLINLTQGLAKTLAPKILVTAICPGPIFPPPTMSRKERGAVAKKTLVGRWGTPEDIAKMAVFLAESDFITGSAHLVDGGESLRS